MDQREKLLITDEMKSAEINRLQSERDGASRGDVSQANLGGMD
jgi:hypothetical protein